MEPRENDEAEEVSEVEALSRGVKAAVDFDRGGGGRNGFVEVWAGE